MKKIFGMFLLLFAMVATPSFAAENTTVKQPLYVVQKGDTAYDLAGVKLNNPSIWPVIVKENRFLQQRGRVFQRGSKTIVLLHPGEQLSGLDKVGIVPHIEPMSALGMTGESPSFWSRFGWFNLNSWWLVPLVLFLLFAAWGLYQLRKDPATSGPPMVNGGVNEQSARTRFQTAAANTYRGRTGQSVATQNFRVISQVAGRISGLMSVNYADGKRRTRHMTDEPAYRALVQFPDGSREDLYMLQRCGNDLRFGGINRYVPGLGFQFTPDAQTVADTSAAAPGSEAAEAPATQPIHADKRVLVEIVPPNGEHETSMVRMKGVDSTRQVSYDVDVHGITTIRFVPLPAGA